MQRNISYGTLLLQTKDREKREEIQKMQTLYVMLLPNQRFFVKMFLTFFANSFGSSLPNHPSRL